MRTNTKKKIANSPHIGLKSKTEEEQVFFRGGGASVRTTKCAGYFLALKKMYWW